MSQASLLPTPSPSPIFNFKNCEIRTVMQDGQPWFVAKDVCAALGIVWNGKFLSNIPEQWQGVRKLLTPSRGGNQNLRIISEPAVYKLAFRSNKPEADEFTNWVASEVLPSIRKTGTFEAAPKPARKPRQKALPPAAPVCIPVALSYAVLSPEAEALIADAEAELVQLHHFYHVHKRSIVDKLRNAANMCIANTSARSALYDVFYELVEKAATYPSHEHIPYYAMPNLWLRQIIPGLIAR